MLAVVALGGAVSPAAALEVPPLTGRIVDAARLLPADLAAALSSELAAHEARTGNQVALLTLPSLEGEPLEEFSHRVATAWKLGQKGTDNGVLVLVVPGDRKVRIEVGYGLEGTLTDAKSAHIIREEMAPRFRSGDFSGGISAGLKAVLGTIEGTYTARPTRVNSQSGQAPTAFQSLVIGIFVGTLAGVVLSQGLQRTRALFGSVLAFLVAQFSSILLGVAAAAVTASLLWLILKANRGGGLGADTMRGSGGGWDSGSFGSDSGFSGGGGDFGGGGASGSW